MLAIAVGLIVWWLSAPAAGAQSEPRPTEQWGTYYNPRFDFCVDFPRAWKQRYSLNGDGSDYSPPTKGSFRETPQIRAYAYLDRPSEQDQRRLLSLEELDDLGLQTLRRYGNAVDISGAERRYVTILGLRALDSSLQYTDSATHVTWFQRVVELIDREGTVYTLALKCSPQDTEGLRPLFERMVASLRLHCKTDRHRKPD